MTEAAIVAAADALVVAEQAAGDVTHILLKSNDPSGFAKDGQLEMAWLAGAEIGAPVVSDQFFTIRADQGKRRSAAKFAGDLARRRIEGGGVRSTVPSPVCRPRSVDSPTIQCSRGASPGQNPNRLFHECNLSK